MKIIVFKKDMQARIQAMNDGDDSEKRNEQSQGPKVRLKTNYLFLKCLFFKFVSLNLNQNILK